MSLSGRGKIRAAVLCLLLQLVGTSSIDEAHTLIRRLYRHKAVGEQGKVASRARLIEHHRRLLHEVEKQVEQGQLEQIAEELQVPVEFVTSWDIKTWLTPAQVCLTEPALKEELKALFSEHVRASATPITKLDILDMTVDMAGEECNEEDLEEPGTEVHYNKNNRRGALTAANAECLTVIVFASAEQPTFNTDAFTSMDGVVSISERTVDSSTIALNASFSPPSPAELDVGAQQDDCCGEDWMSNNVGILAGAIGGAVFLCAMVGFLVTYRRKQAREEEGREEGGVRPPEDIHIQALNPVGGLVRPSGRLSGLVGKTVEQARSASQQVRRASSFTALARSRRPAPANPAEQLRVQQRQEIGEGEGEDRGAPDVDLYVLEGADEERIMEQLGQTAQRIRSHQVAEARPGLSMQDVIKEVRAMTLQDVEQEAREEIERAESGGPATQQPPSPHF